MRKAIGRILMAAAVVSTVATSAHAGKVLWTAPALAAYPNNQTIYCDIVNVGKTPQTISVEVLDYYGNVVGFPILGGTLNPEEGTATGDASGSGARCRFTVSGSTKSVRAVAVYDNGSAYTMSVPAQ